LGELFSRRSLQTFVEIMQMEMLIEEREIEMVTYVIEMPTEAAKWILNTTRKTITMIEMHASQEVHHAWIVDLTEGRIGGQTGVMIEALTGV
jgi:hypothetical protein